jgi:ubiquinol-cytochrome c reductase cytochrome b subunit
LRDIAALGEPPNDSYTGRMKLLDWFDHRTGVRTLVRHLLVETIPGGARWRYVWGSTLAFVFAVQVVTGVLLMTAYSPSATTAWSSVWYIQTQMTLGWLIRGLHHFGSQAMVVLLPLHVLQVLLARAYRAPREFNWWLGLGLLGVVLGLSLTGYLLPWDQKGYWATKVATNIMGLTPVIGDSLQRVVVGGDDYGHATLTRFFTLHVMILPGTLIVLLIAHVALFRKHGVTFSPKDAGKPAGNFWPEQAFRDTAACLVVLAVLLALTYYNRRVVGSPLLDAPADPAASDYPARPEWYFLFLFQMLKYFEGPTLERIGAIGVPGVVGVALFLLPLLDKVFGEKLAHRMSVALCVALFAGAGLLTALALHDDRPPSEEIATAINAKHASGETISAGEERQLRAWDFNRKRERADQVARRALELAAEKGIPPAGPRELLANDPHTRGPELFAANCATCHRFHGHDGLGNVPLEPATSSDLGGFASREWIRGLLADPMSPRYFGLMKNPEGEPAHTRMKKWIADQFEDTDDEVALKADFDAAAAFLSAEAARDASNTSHKLEDHLADNDSPALTDTALIARGREVFMDSCNECHAYQGKRSGTIRAPDMFGYGSVDWTAAMIADPSHESKYGRTGREPARMPAFGDQLEQSDIELLAEWLNHVR